MGAIRQHIFDYFILFLLALILLVLFRLDGKVVGKSPAGWHKADMERWVEQFREENPNVLVPAPENSFSK